MALWQYTFHILPKESLPGHLPGFVFSKNNEEFDDSLFWKAQQVKDSFFDEISLILPKKISWSKKISLYGNQESNCIEVLSENNLVLSVSFRIDFTSNYEDILNALIDFFIVKGLLVIDEELKIISLNSLTIKITIESSPQYKKYKKLFSL